MTKAAGNSAVVENLGRPLREKLTVKANGKHGWAKVSLHAAFIYPAAVTEAVKAKIG